MITGIIGKKIGMTQLFMEDGSLVPVTVIEAGPCTVVQKKTLGKDGYEAVQISFGDVRDKHVTKPMKGHFKSAGTSNAKHLREFDGDISDMELGQNVTVGIFEKGDKISVTGTSKGKGFAGVMKRHGFKGGPTGHGSMFHRAPGSIGCSAWPSRVWKNKKLPGQMGNKKITTLGLEIVDIRSEDNLLLVKGAVPGSKGGLVVINKR
jgi:large subunit ribosomal protein L3